MDLERFQLPKSVIGNMGDGGLPRPKPGERFIRGPIPWSWLAEASRLPGSGFVVAMGVRYLRNRFGRDVVASVAELATEFGLKPTSIRNGLRVAEESALIVADRPPGSKLILTAREVSTSNPSPKPLRGPIPWSWWYRATRSGTNHRVGGLSARTGAVCWLVAGWTRSAEFEMELGRWAELGLSRQAMGRGLRQLDDAGLIELRSGRGRSPIVTILEAPRTA